MQILPSGGEQVSPGPAGLELAPFRGVRYAQERVSGLAEVTSPPYDVIGQDTAQQLRDADPHNVVRLILPRQDPSRPGEEYHDAARLLADWRREGILVAGDEPALYVYEQRLTGTAGDGGCPAARADRGGAAGPGRRPGSCSPTRTSCPARSGAAAS